MSRLLCQIARQKLEQGSSLGTLEQLMGSHTLGSTFKTHFELQIVNFLGLVLFIVWMLSPLGGQSLLRVLHEETRPVDTRVAYFDNIQQPAFDTFLIDESYLSSLLAPNAIKQGPEDLWGNVKIPLQKSSSNGLWTEFDSNSEELSYSSLIGIPVANVSIGNSTFSLESSHISLSCNPMTFLDREINKGVDDFNATFQDLEIEMSDFTEEWPTENGSWYGLHHSYEGEAGDGFPVSWTFGVDRFIDKLWDQRKPSDGIHPQAMFKNETDVAAGPTNMLFQARAILDETAESETLRVGVYQTECRVLQKYVESRVRCTQSSDNFRPACRVVAQRSSQNHHPSEDISYLSILDVFFQVSLLPLMITQASGNMNSEPILSHLYDPSMRSMLFLEGTDLTEVPEEDFSTRLSQIINSHIMLQQLGIALHSQFSEVKMLDNDSESIYNTAAHQEVTAVTTHSLFVYRISWGWMVACILSCVVLAVAGVMGILYTHRGRGPELLGLVSTVLRDSRYIEIVPQPWMDGYELSRSLKDERVRYGHIRHSKAEPAVGIGREENVTVLGKNPL